MLATLKDREGVVRLVGMDEPVRIRTATIESGWSTKEDVEALRAQFLTQLPFVLSFEAATAALTAAAPMDVIHRMPPVEEEDIAVARRRPKSNVKTHDIEDDE